VNNFNCTKLDTGMMNLVARNQYTCLAWSIRKERDSLSDQSCRAERNIRVSEVAMRNYTFVCVI
jgi:hypothetical protein